MTDWWLSLPLIPGEGRVPLPWSRPSPAAVSAPALATGGQCDRAGRCAALMFSHLGLFLLVAFSFLSFSSSPLPLPPLSLLLLLLLERTRNLGKMQMGMYLGGGTESEEQEPIRSYRMHINLVKALGIHTFRS